MIWTADPLRLGLLAAMLCSYALVCLAPFLRQRRKRRAYQRMRQALGAAPAWIVAYASQTGNAEALAGQTAATLRLAGVPVRVSELSALAAADLQGSERILFLASTYGEGDAPDGAAAFASRVMTTALPLQRLHYGVLALGDSSYAQYCGFGRHLDAWLAQQGATPLFARVDVDRCAVAALERWHQHLSHLAGTSDAPDWGAPAFAEWRLVQRRLLNPGSAGAPVYHLALQRADADLCAAASPDCQSGAAAAPDWQSGDLAQIVAPADPAQPREYSIASIPADGQLQLLVRLHRHPDGSPGLASGWLALQAEIGATVQLRLRQHKRFRLEDNAARPLILIGNGSGIAGLRGHLKSRAATGHTENWLLFGERNAAHDYHYRSELDAWQASGVLPRLDMVFSRDQPERLYVQDRLLQRGADVAAWLARGAAVYVCGSLDGMAAGVDRALEQIVGRAALDALAAEGRYRRDVY